MADTPHAPLMTLRSHRFTTQPRPVPCATTGTTTTGTTTGATTGAPAPLDLPLPLRERAAILTAEVTRARSGHARLESRTATVAVVAYPGDRLNRVAQPLVRFLGRGLGLFVRAAADPPTSSRVLLTVDDCGNVTRRSIPR